MMSMLYMAQRRMKRIVSGEIKSTSLERCLPWEWKQEHADMNRVAAA